MKIPTVFFSVKSDTEEPEGGCPNILQNLLSVAEKREESEEVEKGQSAEWAYQFSSFLFDWLKQVFQRLVTLIVDKVNFVRIRQS